MNWSTSPYNQTVKVAILRRFQIKVGKESVFKDCLAAIEADPIANVPELSRVESVFTRELDQGLFLYWLSIDKPEARPLNNRCKTTAIKALKECIELASFCEFQPDQSMFEELRGPHNRHDQYLPGFVVASLVEAAPAPAIF